MPFFDQFSVRFSVLVLAIVLLGFVTHEIHVGMDATPDRLDHRHAHDKTP
jgi:hypothetical protein